MGYLRIALKTRRMDQAELLSLHSIAARAEGKEIKSRLKELLDDGEGL